MSPEAEIMLARVRPAVRAARFRAFMWGLSAGLVAGAAAVAASFRF